MHDLITNSYVQIVGFVVNVSLVLILRSKNVETVVFVWFSIQYCTAIIDNRKNLLNSIISQPERTLIYAVLQSHPG